MATKTSERAIILPAPAPTKVRAKILMGSRPRERLEKWTEEPNIIPETVALPVIKLPRAPIKGANMGKICVLKRMEIVSVIEGN